MTTHPPASFRRAFFALLASFCCFVLPIVSAADAPAKNFDIPAGTAMDSLKQFVAQSGEQLLYSADAIEGIRTHAVSGQLTARDALDKMVADTGLTVVQDRQNGALSLVRASGPNAQRVAQETASDHPSQSPAVEVTAGPTGSVSGTVLRPAGGNSINGLTVTVEETGQTDTTDAYGRFSISGINPGNYTLVVTGNGYAPLKIREVLVQSSTSTTLAAEEMPSPAKGNEAAEKAVTAMKESDVVELEKYEVLDRKPFSDENVDIVRTMDDPQAYYIFQSDTIEQSGALDINDFLKQRLTMDVVAKSNNQSAANTYGATSAINLRGFGASQTLILVNGRRTADIFAGTNGGLQGDINEIPLAAIDRIEVLPASAAAIYGGDAVGGVVNVVLKRQYVGGEIKISYENTTDTDAPIRTIDAAAGMSLENGKTQLMITSHYSDGKNLLEQDRANLVESGLAKVLQNEPSLIYSPTNPFIGATPNIGSSGGSNLVLKSGMQLNSPITFIPNGYSATSNPSALVANAGMYNLTPPNSTDYPYGSLNTISIIPRVKSFLATVRREMTDKLEFFAELSYGSDVGAQTFDPLSSSSLVPATAPTNPFQQAVRIRYSTALPSAMVTTSISRRFTTGFTLQLPWAWKAEADYTWSSASFAYAYSALDSTQLNNALANGTVNPFVDTSTYPLNLLPYLGATQYAAVYTLDDLGLRLAGPLLQLPGGPLQLTFGFEHRKEGNHDVLQYTAYPGFPGDDSTRFYPGFAESINSVYAEGTIPVISKKNNIPAINDIELQLAARSEHDTVASGTNAVFLTSTPPILYRSNSEYTSSNPTMGLRYKPIEDITLRASYGTGFLPPSVAQLAANPVPNSIAIIDPLRGNTSYTIPYIGGGNPNLKPEKSQNWNVGVIFEPSAINGLRLAVDWYRITKTDMITTLAVQNIINDGAAFPGRVTRSAPAVGDPYGVGPITMVDDTYLNLLNAETDGFDVTLEYRKRTAAFGTWDLFVLGTRVGQFEQQTTPNAPYVSYVNEVGFGGNIGTAAGPLRYKGNATLTWEFKRWTFGWTANYYGRYCEYNIGGATAYILAEGSDHIPSQTYHNAFASYKFPTLRQDQGSEKTGRWGWWNRALSDVEIQVGVNDVLNKRPPFDAFFSPYYYSPLGDPRLRDVWLSLSKKL